MLPTRGRRSSRWVAVAEGRPSPSATCPIGVIPRRLWRSGLRVASVRGHGEHLVRHAGLRNGGRRMPWQERSVRPGRRGGGRCRRRAGGGQRRRRVRPARHRAPAARPARPRTRSPVPYGPHRHRRWSGPPPAAARSAGRAAAPPSAAGGSASREPGARRPGRPSGRPSRATAGPPPPVWTTRPTCTRCPRTPGPPLSARHSPRGLTRLGRAAVASWCAGNGVVLWRFGRFARTWLTHGCPRS